MGCGVLHMAVNQHDDVFGFGFAYARELNFTYLP